MMSKDAKTNDESSPVNTPSDKKSPKDTGKKPRAKNREPKPAQKVVPMFRRQAAAGGRSVDTLARITGTDGVLLAALKSAYGWTERTLLSRAEFLILRDQWLQRPAKEE